MTSKLDQIFISYSRKDDEPVGRIIEALRKQGLTVWQEIGEVQPGERWIDRIGSGLAESAYVLLVLSPNALASRWVALEWQAALADERTVIIPVLIAPVELPTLLKSVQAVDLHRDWASGIEKLVRFFRREQEPLPRTMGPTGVLADASRAEIRKVAKRCLDKVAFKEFLLDYEIDEGSIGGDSLHERIVNLLVRTDSDGLWLQFTRWIEGERGPCVRTQLAKLRADSAA